MPALKQTLYVEFEIEDGQFSPNGTTFSRELNLSFVPDYVRIKQLTHFSSSGEYDLNTYYISSSMLPESKIFAVAVGNYNGHPDLYFPVGRSVSSSFDFTIRSKGDGNNLDGIIIMALEFTKELGYKKLH